jgi:hypothetical protein
MSRRAATVLAAVVIGLAVRVSATSPRQNAAALADRVEIPAFGTTVAMDDGNGRPVVPVWVDGHGPYAFVVSTTATVTALSQDLVNELGLASDVDQLAATPLVLDELRVGEAVVRGAPAGRTIVASAPDEMPVRGILSAASFPGALLSLDYPNSKLRLTPGELREADGRRVFDYASDEAGPVVPIDVAGHGFDVRVDSMAPGGLTLPTHDEAELPLADEPIEIGLVTDSLGEFPLFVATLNGVVSIGGVPLDIHSIVFSDLRALTGAGTGTIGARILETFTVTLDGKNHRVRFARPPA